ncbi:MAG: cation:dicarboxylase symporter family transporter [Saprospiraceae bacterium]|nr:cation:dicarboxylase symporter family transporter [Saprospiraceae bacterium]
MKLQKSLTFALISIAIVAGIHLLQHYLPFTIDPTILIALRWWAIGALCYFGWQNNSLTTWILLSMIIGMEFGVDFPKVGAQLEFLSKIFIQLIKTVIAPLLFGTLVVGIAAQKDSAQVGRISAKAFTYFILATSIALVVGLVAINWTRAGEGIHVAAVPSDPVVVSGEALTVKVDSLKGTYQLMYGEKVLAPPATKVKQDWKYVVLHIFPENVAKMIYEGAVLQIVVFSLLFGFALRQVDEPYRQTMLMWTESLTEVMFKFVHLIMYAAPLAVGGAMAYTIGSMGFDVVWNLLKLLLTLYVALFVFVLMVFIPVLWIIRVPVGKFFKVVREPASLAFATASSEAALPLALESMEKFGVPRNIVSFVLPTGYSFNLDGSTLYLSLAAVFCAQAAGIELSWGTQLAMMGTLLLTSKGVAGVPRASLVILAATVNQFDIPEWPIAVILGIDALMDMGRTAINLTGNCLASVVVARWEGELDDEAVKNF